MVDGHLLRAAADLPESRWWWILLATLLAADLSLAAAHLAWGLVPSGLRATDSPWNLSTEGGVGEAFEYLKLTICACVMVAIRRSTGAAVFAMFAGLYMLTLADDMFQLHERIGDQLHMVGPDHVAQLLVYLIAGTVLLTLAIRVIRRTSSRFMPDSLLMVTLFGLLACFSVGLDALHMYNIVEEGGELVTLSLHVAFALLLLAKHRRLPAAESLRQPPVTRAD